MKLQARELWLQPPLGSLEVCSEPPPGPPSNPFPLIMNTPQPLTFNIPNKIAYTLGPHYILGAWGCFTLGEGMFFQFSSTLQKPNMVPKRGPLKRTLALLRFRIVVFRSTFFQNRQAPLRHEGRHFTCENTSGRRASGSSEPG